MKALNKKAKILGISMAVAGMFAMSSAAQAAPIVGEINFTGSLRTVNSANALTTMLAATGLKFNGSFGTPLTPLSQSTKDGEQTGAYAVLNGANRTATFKDFQFPIGLPSPNPSVNPVWDVVLGANHFWFDLTKIDVVFQGKNSLNLEGTGIAYGAGYDSAPGTFVITANSSGSRFSFSASSTVPAPVPAALFFVAPALLGLFGVSRRKDAAGLAA
ncbi:MAG: hypothetical protein NTX45_30040 [Proteobacteria bacterium]|nr:hypothetical protein [Pseudomonadota bacterium]